MRSVGSVIAESTHAPEWVIGSALHAAAGVTAGLVSSAAPTGTSAGVALFAGAVAHHGEVLALRAHVAGIALHDRLLTPRSFERPGFLGFARRRIGEKRR